MPQRPDAPARAGLTRRDALGGGAAAALALLPGMQPAFAQGRPYPSQPIRMVSPFAAGGTIDVAVRPLIVAMSESMGQQILLDSRPGANGIIGTEFVAKSAPDGYTLLAVTASFALNASMYNNLKYDVIKDFQPVAGLMRGVGFVIVVHPSVQAHTLQELIALDKKPGAQMNYSSPGVGNTIHIASELFNQSAGTRFLHVPYKGSSTSLNALVAGEVQLAIMPPGIVMPFITSGKLRALAFTGTERLPDLPNVPLTSEAGLPGFSFTGTWIGLLAPAATPRPVVDKLYAEVTKGLKDPAVRQNIASSVPGYLPDGSSPEAFGKQVREDVQRYSEIVRKFNIKPE